MVGDYCATAFSGGLAHGAYAVAVKPKGTTFGEHMATTLAGEPAFQGFMRFTSRGEHPLRGAHSDHPRLWLPPFNGVGG
jgi:hypothetical protein